MTAPTNNLFTPELALTEALGVNSAPFLETRIENNGNGQPVYIGWSPIANEATSNRTWFIKKISYEVNNAVSRYQLPNNGLGFVYIWDDRATYFS